MMRSLSRSRSVENVVTSTDAALAASAVMCAVTRADAVGGRSTRRGPLRQERAGKDQQLVYVEAVGGYVEPCLDWRTERDRPRRFEVRLP